MASVLVNPYIMCEMKKRVSLLPYQMNFNLYNNLKTNLIRAVERKCNDIGFIVKVYKITNYKTGILESENLSGNAIYTLTYIANVCKPIEKTQIIVKIDMPSNNNIVNIKTLKAIKAVNGPIDCVILSNLIDMDNFTINGDGSITCKRNGALMQNQDYVKVTIQNLNINAGMNNIVMIGYMNDMATEEEVEMYFKVPNMQENTEVEQDGSNQIQIFE